MIMKNNKELLCVGDRIKFDYFGKREQGIIQTIGKHGYWIESSEGCYGTAHIRCPFELARLIKPCP